MAFPNMARGDHLFVYGTLRKATDHPLHGLLAKSSDFVGEAIFQGKLYDLGSYPGAVRSDQPSDAVRGELYILRDRDRVLGALDEYEGPGFRREKVFVSLENGKRVRAWLYLYDRPTTGLPFIPSGDYLQWIKAEEKYQGLKP